LTPLKQGAADPAAYLYIGFQVSKGCERRSLTVMPDTRITRTPLDPRALREGFLAGRRGITGEANPYQVGTHEALWQKKAASGRGRRSQDGRPLATSTWPGFWRERTLPMKLIARICCLSFLALQLLAIPASAQSQSVTIEKLVTDGWEAAGYISVSGNRSLILFKHRDYKYLVQCSVLVDVTRAQSLVITCYDLK
jgi:hypothetical protein